MTDSKQTLTAFISEVKPNQLFWALQDQNSADWVVLDSINFEDTDVMPVWSTAQLAQQHCCDEWQDYVPTQITLSDWLEFWVEDLNEDGVIIGVNWQDEGDCLEVELSEFTQALASIEQLK